MINLGLSEEDQAAFEAALTSDHRIKTLLTILDREENIISDIGDVIKIAEGSVQIDVTSQVKRQFTATLVDDTGQLSFDPNAPTDTALAMDRYIKVQIQIWVPAISRWISVPIFTGPITQLSRQGSIVGVEAMGKEILGLAPDLMWNSPTFNKGEKVTDAIKSLLDGGGENHYSIPNLSNKLQSKLSVVKLDERWTQIVGLAEGIGYSIFYDGDGYVRMRKNNFAQTWNFAFGIDVVGDVSIPYDFTSVRNIVQAHATIDDKDKTAEARLDPSNPVSPESLSRRGKNRYLVEDLNFDNVESTSELQDLADAALSDLKLVSSDIQMEVLPIPHLEEYDWCTLDMPGMQRVGFRIKTMSIPLTSDTMSIGFLKSYRIKKRPT